MARRRCSKWGGDIDDEGGTDGGVGGGVENFEGAVRLAVDGQLLEAGEEAAFVTESGSVVVVRMAGFPVGKDDGFGAELADYGSETEFVLAAGLDVGIGDAERAAPAYAKYPGGFGGFFGADLGSAARAHLSCSEIENAGFVAAMGHF